MHQEVKDYLTNLKGKFPRHFLETQVLEIGSYNINGSVRDFFLHPSTYVGVDLIEGPMVDVVSLGHEYKALAVFDVVISTEAFEHDPYWPATFRNMVMHCRPGGLVVVTCAGAGRNPHGVAGATPEDSPGTMKQGWNHYQNLTDEDFFSRFPLCDWFRDHQFEFNGKHGDLYFWGIRK